MKKDSSKPSIMRKLFRRFRRRQCHSHFPEKHRHPNHQNSCKHCLEETEIKNANHLNDTLSSRLPTEVQLYVFSFLDIQSLTCMMSANHAWHSFLSSSEDVQRQLWWKHCQSIWNLPSDLKVNLIDELSSDRSKDDDAESSTTDFTDDVVDADGESQQQQQQVMDFHKLLSKTPLCRLRPCINDDHYDSLHPPHHDHQPQQPQNHQLQLVLPTTMNPLFGRTSPLRAFHRNGTLSLRMIHYYNTHQAFSARADHPLARPKSKKRKRNNKLVPKWIYQHYRQWKNPEWNAICCPYSLLRDPCPNTIYITPRLVSYFEITLQPPSSTLPLSSFSTTSSWMQDCVVIGLAPSDFDSKNDLPGWDGNSFGYHSDTGALYHGGFYNSGGILSAEAFGTGDTVGMGMDYVRRGIFVTKNGRLLGVFFDRIKVDYLANTDLYPVVGMDSKDIVIVNYGGYGKPFMFDLAEYCHQQQQELPPKRRIHRTR